MSSFCFSWHVVESRDFGTGTFRSEASLRNVENYRRCSEHDGAFIFY